jgi:hypothetical protein
MKMSNVKEEKVSYGLSDQVIARIAQIVQESMMTGIDCVDLLRQVRVEASEGGHLLALTDDYKQLVKTMHDRLLADAERLQREAEVKAATDTAGKLFGG